MYGRIYLGKPLLGALDVAMPVVPGNRWLDIEMGASLMGHAIEMPVLRDTLAGNFRL
jgi:hypothetical protein